MNINDFKRKQSTQKTDGFNDLCSELKATPINQRMEITGFSGQSGMKIQNELTIYYCTKCGMQSLIKMPTKCPQGGFHIWAKGGSF